MLAPGPESSGRERGWGRDIKALSAGGEGGTPSRVETQGPDGATRRAASRRVSRRGRTPPVEAKACPTHPLTPPAIGIGARQAGGRRSVAAGDTSVMHWCEWVRGRVGLGAFGREGGRGHSVLRTLVAVRQICGYRYGVTRWRKEGGV